MGRGVGTLAHKMRVLSCIVFLVVSTDLGYSKPNDQKVVDTRSSSSSCTSLGGSCMTQDLVKSFVGGTTTRCFGTKRCRKGFLCCIKQKVKTGRALPSKKKKQKVKTGRDLPSKKKKTSGDSPGRAVKCPPQTRCGSPDTGNPEGGRCRKKCKPKNEGSKDPLGKCPLSDCQCCFRQRKCKTRKSCTKKSGTCKGFCEVGETQQEKGCKNGCVCCVGPELPKRKCDSCKEEGGKCRKGKRNCDETWGEREFPQYADGDKKCCLKDCLHVQMNLWYVHGEEFYWECEKGVCKNGVVKTFGVRHPSCCTVDNHDFYYENNVTFCVDIDRVEYSYYCNNGTSIKLPEVVEDCCKHIEGNLNKKNQNQNKEECQGLENL